MYFPTVQSKPMQKAHHSGLGKLALLALAIWGGMNILPDLVRYIKISRM